MLNDLAKLLEIESVFDADTVKDGAPFGSNMKNTLEFFLETAKGYGLEVKNYDGFCGHVEYGHGEKCIGILAHLDVVPAGSGWTYPAYGLTVKDGYFYGRGIVDNKGCAVIALHILKELKEKAVKLNNRIRLIVGCNEENGSACMKHYKSVGEIPSMSIVPDSDFPIINSEKGILHVKISIPADDFLKNNIESFSSGNRPNVVPDHARAVLTQSGEIAKKLKSYAGGKMDNTVFFDKTFLSDFNALNLKSDEYFLSLSGGKIILESKGVSGHAMNPAAADNAIFKLVSLLEALSGSRTVGTLQTIHMQFCNSAAAEALGIACNDKKSGMLTMNVGIMEYNGKSVELTLDLRLPICADKDKISDKIKSFLPNNTVFTEIRFSKNLFIDENDILVKTLLKVYAETTGNSPYTVQTGGGTYARELPNSVAFGPTFPATVTNIHNIDERMSIEQFNKLYEIYYKAVLELDKI